MPIEETHNHAMTRPIRLPLFISYKFLNSLFLGLSVGTVFVLYTPLSPAVFSAGGIGLAIGTLLVAMQYQRILNANWFYRISMLVEWVVLAGIVGVLTFDLNPNLAMFIYLGYQFTFLFGSYLVRCETLLIPEQHRLTQLDVAKQMGYLGGMAMSWGIYQGLSQWQQITDKELQVLMMHYPMLGVELAVLLVLWLAFRRPETTIPAGSS